MLLYRSCCRFVWWRYPGAAGHARAPMWRGAMPPGPAIALPTKVNPARACREACHRVKVCLPVVAAGTWFRGCSRIFRLPSDNEQSQALALRLPPCRHESATWAAEDGQHCRSRCWEQVRDQELVGHQELRSCAYIHASSVQGIHVCHTDTTNTCLYCWMDMINICMNMCICLHLVFVGGSICLCVCIFCVATYICSQYCILVSQLYAAII